MVAWSALVGVALMWSKVRDEREVNGGLGCWSVSEWSSCCKLIR